MPLFKHDCDRCTYLGQSDLDGPCDLYHCVQGGGMHTVIARYSDEGHDYNSGWPSQLPVLVEAHRRAVEKKLMPDGDRIVIGPYKG